MEYRCSTFNELKGTLDELVSTKSIFRGISHQKDLLPKLIRDDWTLGQKERSILEQFEKYYGLYASVNGPWEFLALAQHYGLMTRLIDFTTNPYVALFFALHSAESDCGGYRIVVVKPENYRRLNVETDPHFDVQDGNLFFEGYLLKPTASYSQILEEEFKEIPDDRLLYIAEPNYRNARVLMQNGLFVVPPKIERDHIKKLFEDLADFIVIDDSIRDESLSFLEKMGFDEFHLMPDLASVCSEINLRKGG